MQEDIQAQFLRHGVSARDIALSGATIASYEDGFTAFTNPAMIAMKKELTIGSSLFLLLTRLICKRLALEEICLPMQVLVFLLHLGTSNIFYKSK